MVVEEGICEDMEAEYGGEEKARDAVISIILLLLVLLSSLLVERGKIFCLFGEVCEG
jgi:hypothetical protein